MSLPLFGDRAIDKLVNEALASVRKSRVPVVVFVKAKRFRRLCEYGIYVFARNIHNEKVEAGRIFKSEGPAKEEDNAILHFKVTAGVLEIGDIVAKACHQKPKVVIFDFSQKAS